MAQDQVQNDQRSDYYNNRDYPEIRVLKDGGFFGITLPVIARFPDTTAQTAANYTAPCFIANRTYQLISITERHETAGTDGGSVTLMLKKVPSGTAPGSGTDMLSTGMSLKTTANTNQSGSVTVTIDNKRLLLGDALSFVATGTLTSLKGVTASIILKAI